MAVPQGERKAQPLLLIADSREAVFAPAICPAARVVVGKVVPGIAIGGIIFAHCSPLAFAEVRPPEGVRARGHRLGGCRHESSS